MILANLRNPLPEESNNTNAVDQLQTLCQDMSQGIYRLMHDLRPTQLDNLGFVPAMQDLADEGRVSLDLEICTEDRGTRQRLDPLVGSVIFRVAQETLTNGGRHARTDRSSLHMDFGTDEFNQQVHNAGVGFNPNESILFPRGWGFAGMRERLSLLVVNSCWSQPRVEAH